MLPINCLLSLLDLALESPELFIRGVRAPRDMFLVQLFVPFPSFSPDIRPGIRQQSGTRYVQAGT